MTSDHKKRLARRRKKVAEHYNSARSVKHEAQCWRLTVGEVAQGRRARYFNKRGQVSFEKRSFKMTKCRATHFFSTEEVDGQSLEAMCHKLADALQSSDSFQELVKEIREKDSNLKLTLSASIFHAPID